MDTLAPLRRYFRWAAIGATVMSALLTFQFGWQSSPYIALAIPCALFLVLCSVASDYIGLFLREAWARRDYGTAALLAGGTAFVFSLNLMSNLGSVGYQRDTASTVARVHNAKHDDARDEVKEGKASLEMWSKRLADLEAANAWAATVSADALRAQAAAEERRGGCGPRCLDIKRRLAIAEETTDLRSKIEATRRIVSNARDKAATKTAVVSAPDAQARFFASMVTVDLNPSTDAMSWTDRGMASWLALGLCFAPIVFASIGWPVTRQTVADEPKPAPAPATQTPAPQPTQTRIILDETLKRWAKSPEANAIKATA